MGHPDPLVRIRCAALDVLTLLCEQESLRAPLSDDAYAESSDQSWQGRIASSDVLTDASFLVSLMRVGE